MPGECEIEADATICNGCCGNAYFREYECAGGGSTKKKFFFYLASLISSYIQLHLPENVRSCALLIPISAPIFVCAVERLPGLPYIFDGAGEDTFGLLCKLTNRFGC